MVASMTGFACRTGEQKWGTLTWEIRSVNHRFLEISMRLPENLRQIEMQVRERIQNTIKRGKVECNLKFSSANDINHDLAINKDLLQKLSQNAEIVKNYFPQSTLNLVDILNWPGVLSAEQIELEQLISHALQLFDVALNDLAVMRKREGDGIKRYIQERLNEIGQHVKVIEKRLPLVREQFSSRIHTRFAELSLEIDQERFEQEMVWLLQKMDVAEEIQRLRSHVTEVERALKGESAIGRRLDFLMQELNREANTLGSKSIDAEMTQAVVELKVLIEQMREQVQNIE